MEVTVIETNKGHKSILCEDFRYRLDVETKSGNLSWICSTKGCKARVRTDAGPTMVPLSRADKEKECPSGLLDFALLDYFSFAQMSIWFFRFRSFGLFFFRSNVHFFFVLLGCHFAQMSSAVTCIWCIILIYSQICTKRSHLRQRKCGLLRQVTS